MEEAMPKLRLDIEALAVESFKTAEKKGERGTVLGASEPQEPQTNWAYCSMFDVCTGNCSAMTSPMLCGTGTSETIDTA
jgi:hypothetical protein